MKTPDKIYISSYDPSSERGFVTGCIEKMKSDDVEYIRKDALISFLEKEKHDLFNWHFQDEDRKFKVYEEVINKIKEL